MKTTPGQPGFSERRSASLDAKKQLLAKLQSAPKLTMEEQRARDIERTVIGAARAERDVERKAAKKAEAERAAAEAAHKAVTAAKDAAEAAEAKAALEEREILERKAERDRRYAARKATKR